MTTPSVTVPVEPTDEMLRAGKYAYAMTHEDDALKGAWAVMLSAAPAPDGGAVSDALQRLRVLRDQARNGTAVTDPDEYDADELDAILSVIEPALATRADAPAELSGNPGELEAPAEAGEQTAIARAIRRAIGDAWIGEHQAEVAAEAVIALRTRPQARSGEVQ